MYRHGGSLHAVGGLAALEADIDALEDEVVLRGARGRVLEDLVREGKEVAACLADLVDLGRELRVDGGQCGREGRSLLIRHG